jgi:hypothetical protein
VAFAHDDIEAVRLHGSIGTGIINFPT